MPGELRSALLVCVVGTALTTPSLADLTREPLEVQAADVESAQIAGLGFDAFDFEQSEIQGY
jgi:hypothetical protein